MAVLQSALDLRGSEAQANAAHMEGLVASLRDRLRRTALGGSQASRERHVARGKLLTRDRIDTLIDTGSAFLELSPLAANGMYDDEAPAGGIVTGVGVVHGRECVIVANDPTVKGGTYYPITVKKHLRAQEVALHNHLPCLYLVDSGGAFLPMQDEVFPDRDHFGRIFFNQATMSARGIPQIAAVLGSCTAGGAYVPAMSDEAVIVRDQGTIFLGGPPLVKAATGENVTAEELGGGDLHARVSGVTDHLAHDDVHALHIVRDIVDTFGPRAPAPWEVRESVEPLHSPADLGSVVPADPRQSYNCIARPGWLDFKPAALVDHCLNRLMHIVGFAWVDRHQPVQAFILARRVIAVCNKRWVFNVVGRQVRQKLAHQAKRITFILCRHVRYTTDRHVNG